MTTTLPSGGVVVQLNPQQLAHVLAVWTVARLATIGPRGAPHLVPVVFAALDGVIYSPVDAKPKRHGDLQRLRNVARDDAACLLLDHYSADWDALWWLRIDCTAQALTGDDLPAHERDRVVAALRAKYPQYRTVAPFRDAPALLLLRPRRHVAWSARPLAWESIR